VRLVIACSLLDLYPEITMERLKIHPQAPALLTCQRTETFGHGRE